MDIKKISDKFSEVIQDASDISKKVGKQIEETSNKVVNKTSSVIDTSKDKLITAMDQNGDNEITIEDIIIMGLKVPGVKINRAEFLRKEFSTNYDNDIVERIVKYNPAHEGIGIEKIDKIAEEVIQYERLCVSGISTALSVPGGIAMVATLPTDIAQYYGYMLRAMQKLLYLYGFPEIDIENEQLLDSATLNTIIICMGVMYGVANANIALKSMAKALGVGVEKQLMKKALTKGTIYPIVKSVSKWFNVKMTKEVFAGFFKKSIPIVGGVIGGGLTYLSFKPCCEKLKDTLHDTKLSNPSMSNDDNLIEIN